MVYGCYCYFFLEEGVVIQIYIYIYITEVFKTLTIFYVSTIFKKLKLKLKTLFHSKIETFETLTIFHVSTIFKKLKLKTLFHSKTKPDKSQAFQVFSNATQDNLHSVKNFFFFFAPLSSFSLLISAKPYNSTHKNLILTTWISVRKLIWFFFYR